MGNSEYGKPFKLGNGEDGKPSELGNSEYGNPSKPEKLSSTIADHSSINVCPDWAMMQVMRSINNPFPPIVNNNSAFYGPPFAMPPYMNSAIPPPQVAPPYMWAPLELMMPHHGLPHAAFYAHGGVNRHYVAPYSPFYPHGDVYGHPGVSTGGTPFSTDTPVRLPENNTDCGFTKKLKEFDAHAALIGNGNADNGKRGTEHAQLKRKETAESSEGSNGVMAEAGKIGMKRSRAGFPNSEIKGSGKVRTRPIRQKAVKTKSIATSLERMKETLNKMLEIFAEYSQQQKEALQRQKEAIKRKKEALAMHREYDFLMRDTTGMTPEELRKREMIKKKLDRS